LKNNIRNVDFGFLIVLALCIGSFCLSLPIFAENVKNKDVNTWIQDLENPDWQIRASAASELGVLKDPLAVQPLILALKDKKWQVQEKAAWALGEIGDKQAVEPLLKLLKGKLIINYLPSLQAALSLGKLGDQRAVKSLITIIKNKGCNPDHREAAAKALGMLKASEAVDPLIAILKSHHIITSILTGGALNDAFDSLRLTVIEVLGQIEDKRAIEPLISIIINNDKISANQREAAVKSLGMFKAIEPLAGLIESAETTTLLDSVVDALVIIGEPAVPRLMQILNSDNKNVYYAIQALVEIDPNSEDLIAYLIQSLKGGKNLSPYNAALTLGACGSNAKASVPFLIEFFPKKTVVIPFKKVIGSEPLVGGIIDYNVRRREVFGRNSAWGEIVIKDLKSQLKPLVGDYYTVVDVSGLFQVIYYIDYSVEVTYITADTTCTVSAGAYALNRITGFNLGTDQTKWQQWWEENKAKY
jgi:HEAT repeat protein